MDEEGGKMRKAGRVEEARIISWASSVSIASSLLAAKLNTLQSIDTTRGYVFQVLWESLGNLATIE